jgi:oligopeptide/dipeptide ABC transporter ATP-binding protein
MHWTLNLLLPFTCVPLFVSRVRPIRKPYMPLLLTRRLTVAFPHNRPIERAACPAVDRVSLTLEPGRILALVGPTASGKSTIARAIATLLPPPPASQVSGHILLDGNDILGPAPPANRHLRGKIVGYLAPDPDAALNPIRTVSTHILEVLNLHQPKNASRDQVLHLLHLTGVVQPDQSRRFYPHQLPADAKRRVALARALAARPKLLVADEPTNALDPTSQAPILDLIKSLPSSLGLGILFLTRDLALAAHVAHHTAILYAGQIVESGPTIDLLRHPFHPYTRTLIRSVPALGSISDLLAALPDTHRDRAAQPSPPGCRFQPHCTQRRPDCAEQPPALFEPQAGRHVRCLYPLLDQP